MKDLINILTVEKNQFVLASLGLFWVSNVGSLILGDTFLARIFIYPIFLLLIVIFIRLLFCLLKIKPFIDNTTYIIFFVFAVLGCVCVARGVPLYMDIDKIRPLLFDLLGSALVWLMPLSIFFSIKGQFWMTWLPKLRKIVFFGLLYFIAISLISIGLEGIFNLKLYNSMDFVFIAPFLIIWSRFRKDSADLFLGLFGIGVICILMFLLNGRYAIAYSGLMCFIYLFFLPFEKYSLNLKINTLTLCLMISVIFGVFILQAPFFEASIDRYIFQGEIFQDTRGGGSLAASVTENMSLLEELFGKGIDGVYTWGYIGWPPQPYIRPNVEIGYMQMLLKGGYVTQITFLALSLHAVYLAIFRSNNRITRYLSYIVIARLILMATAMSPCVGFEYFMYWLVIGGCLSAELRSFSDNDIREKCNNNRIDIEW